MVHALLILVALTAQARVSAEPTVVFVCEHGAAKSVIAATYFNKIAAARGRSIAASLLSRICQQLR